MPSPYDALAQSPPAVCPITGQSVVTPLHPLVWARVLHQTGYPWTEEIERIVTGLVQGVDIGYMGDRDRSRDTPNLPTADEAAVQKDIDTEMELGRKAGPYDTPPYPNLICSPIGTVSKRGSSKLRVIHHLSYPRTDTTSSINSCIDPALVHVQLGSFDTAIEYVSQAGPGAYLAKIDIKAAYRCIPIRPADWCLLGFRWKGKWYFDKNLPFGLSSSCLIWERYARAVHWIMYYTYGISLAIHYIDDTLIVATSRPLCAMQLKAVLLLLEQLGLPVAPEKVEGPSTRLIFLGIQIDTVAMCVSLDSARLAEIHDSLGIWERKQRASKVEIQSLVGVLQFAAKVIRPGRMFTRRLIEHMSTIPEHAADREYPLPAWVKKDLVWWHKWMDQWNGRRQIHPPGWTRNADLHLYTDASKTGYGAVYGSQWFAGTWSEEECRLTQGKKRDNMPGKELLCLVKAAATWGAEWSRKNLMIELHSDCLPVVMAAKTDTSRSQLLMSLLRTLTYLAATHEFDYRLLHVSGVDNDVADGLSRGQISEVLQRYPALNRSGTTPVPLPIHDW